MPARRTSNAKRVVRRKTTVPRGVRSKVVSIRRSYQDATIGSNTSVSITTGSFAVALSACPAYGDFTNLFDTYRIVKVKYDFFPNLTDNMSGAAIYNVFHMAVDHTDVTAPTSDKDILQYDNHRSVQPYKPFSITWKPAPSAAFYNGATTTGYGPKAGAWIDAKSPSVPHYGLKFCWDCNSATATQILPFVTVWAEFKEAQ